VKLVENPPITEVVDIHGASAVTHVNVATLRHWRWKNVGPPSFVVGGKLLYRVEELHKWVEHQEKTTRRGDVLD
jgi:hypothetical protein